MPHTNPGENLATDPAWAGTARFLDGRVPPGLRVVAPGSFAGVLGPLAPPEPEPLPDWAVIAVRDPGPADLLRRLLEETTPVYANDGFVVFARRPTFGLADMRNAGPVRSLAERARSEPAAPPPRFAPPPLPPAPSLAVASVPKASEPPEAVMAPIAPPQAPGIPRSALPPEALALRVPPPPAPRAELPTPPEVRAPIPLPAAQPPVLTAAPAPRPSPPPLPIPPPPAPAPAPAAAPQGGTAWGTLPARIGALLGPMAGRRLAGIGTEATTLAGLAAPSALLADAAAPQPDACFDAALVLPGAESLAEDLTTAARLLRPGGAVLVVAENAQSLGRRLAAALGREASGGLAAGAVRGAFHAAGLSPARLEGHSLDTWRATADAPPPGLAAADPASALLEEAGEAAGPNHAAWLLFLGRKV